MSKHRFVVIVFLLALASCATWAQDISGAITGTVKDTSGSVVPGAAVKSVNTATNLEVNAKTDGNGSYLLPNLPTGTYKVTISKEGFQTENHTQILVDSGRTTTVDGDLKIGQASVSVDVTAVPLMNQTDTTNGYAVDQLTIQQTPLGPGSFPQLAIMTP